MAFIKESRTSARTPRSKLCMTTRAVSSRTTATAALAIIPVVLNQIFDNVLTPRIVGGGVGLHPHSGIATLTVLLQGATRYEDTTGATGVLP